jgi:hypothetical protein
MAIPTLADDVGGTVTNRIINTSLSVVALGGTVTNENKGSVSVSGNIGILSHAIVPITFPLENRVDLRGTVGYSYEMDKVNPWTNIPVEVSLAIPESDYVRVYVSTICTGTFFIARSPYEYYGAVIGSKVYTNAVWQTVAPSGGSTNSLTLRVTKQARQAKFYLWTTMHSDGSAVADPNWTNRLVNIWVDTWNQPTGKY